MRSQVFKRGPVTPQMNITPLIDVVFLLIIFFMLVTNIIAEEAVDMIVPQLDDPETRELGNVDRVVVNLSPHPYGVERLADHPLNYPGDVYQIQIGHRLTFAADNLARLTAELEDAIIRGPHDASGNSTLEVVLRADAALFYSEVAPALEAITAAGISKINMVAYLPEYGPTQKALPPLAP